MTDPNNPSAPQPPAYQPPAYPASSDPSYGAPAAAAPGKTLGIVAFVLALVPVGLQLIGLILGIVALVQSKKAGRGNGFAIAAIIIGAISVVVGLIVTFAVIVPSLNAATTCLNDPTAVVQVWGVDLSCQEVLEQSNR